ncbi:MAG: redox-regulated ATPase YchF [Candidatus Saccharibacteria bacterium]|nr:redox-regulated ATPase YchF [Candidatus Saccharibacteria bacterium]
MSLSIGLVGLPNAGKSTLFNALTCQEVLMADYPFATIEPHYGIVAIPDSRLKVLANIFNSSKITPATIEFIDIAGLIKGAHQGEGLGNQFLSHIRQTSLIAQIVGVFNQNNIAEDLEIIRLELMLADNQSLTRHQDKIQKNARTDKQLAKVLEILQLAKAELDQEIWLYDSPHRLLYLEHLNYLNLLTLKPTVAVINYQNSQEQRIDYQSLETKKIPLICLDAKLELEISQLQSEDQAFFLKEYNLRETGLDRLARLCFETLNLQTFLTAGQKETRAWIIPSNCPAPEAAGIIHSDMQTGFIAVDVINYSDLIKFKSWSLAKSSGVCRTEGKNYLMKTDDVVEFKFNL